VINPNNPNTHLYSLPTLHRWQQQLMQVGGWLIVDEAFMDSTPEHSLLQYDMSTMPNLIVLRSLGKFFGLAGLRLGFIVANPTILAQLQHLLGTWPISNPSRYLGKKALLDTVWQQQTRLNLKQKSQQLQQLLQQRLHQYSDKPIFCTSLFCYIKSRDALLLHTQLAQYGIWIRYFAKPEAVRIGLPQNEQQFYRLLNAIKASF
jgi:cobalamin biosynthetic protein CobC